MERNGYYYIRVQRNQKIIKFSTKTKDKNLAYDIYRDFLRELALLKIPAVVQRDSSGVSISSSREMRKEPTKAPSIPDTTVPEPEGISFPKCFSEYMDTCAAKGYAKKTLTMKSYCIKRLEAVGVSSMNHINQDTVNTFTRNLTGSSDYKQEAIKQLKAFLNFCIKKGYFSRDSYSRIEFPRFKKMKRETVITTEDFRKIQEHLQEKGDHDFAFYLRTLYETVTRPSEAAVLRVEDFDFATGSVSVMMGKIKQRKRAFLRDSYLKDLQQYLKDYGITDRIFAGFGRSKEFYQNKFSKTRERLGLNKKYNLYAFRHTAISDLVNSTNDIEFAAKQAGNSPELALKHYLHRSDRHYQDLIRKASESSDKK